GGEELICSNTYLTNSRVHNYKRMEQRRVVFKLSISRLTPQNRLREVTGMITNIIESEQDLRFNRGHFSGFGEFSFDFEFVYYVLSPDYNLYMDKQQEVLLNIAEAFDREGIEFAYPTQSLFLRKGEVAVRN